MSFKSRLTRSWPWHKIWIAFVFWFVGIGSFLAIHLLKPYYGNAAYLMLGFAIWGILFAILYTYVSTKISKKMAFLRSKDLEPFDGLVSFGKLQAPSAIALSKDTLFFAPIVGPEINYPLHELSSLKVSTNLPGKRFVFKQSFHLSFINQSHIDFAVDQYTAKDIYRILQSHIKS